MILHTILYTSGEKNQHCDLQTHQMGIEKLATKPNYICNQNEAKTLDDN